MKTFDYIKAHTIEEAITLLDKYKEKAKIFAGGTDLLVQMKQRRITPEYLIDIKGIAELECIERNNQGLKIGPLTTHASIANSPVIQEKFCLLVDAALAVHAVQIQSRGTIGGNICNASPSADTAPPLLALGAKLKLASKAKERTVMLEDFFTDSFKTILKETEMLTEIQIPNLPPHSGGSYSWLPKITAVDETLVGVGVVITLDSTGKICSDVKIGLGSVAPTPMRAKKAEEFLRGKKIEDGLFAQAGQIASNETIPRSRAEYRSKMVKVYVERGLNQAWGRIS